MSLPVEERKIHAHCAALCTGTFKEGLQYQGILSGVFQVASYYFLLGIPQRSFSSLVERDEKTVDIRYKNHVSGILENGPEEIVRSKNIKFGSSLFPICSFFGSTFPPWKENRRDPFPQRFSAGIIHLTIGIPVSAAPDHDHCQVNAFHLSTQMNAKIRTGRTLVEDRITQQFVDDLYRLLSAGSFDSINLSQFFDCLLYPFGAHSRAIDFFNLFFEFDGLYFFFLFMSFLYRFNKIFVINGF
jgi:hypothetical protein